MRITVLMGGSSAERDVSLASGVRIAAALRERGHRVTAMDPACGVLDENALAALQAGPIMHTAPPSLEMLRCLGRNAGLDPAFAQNAAIRDCDVVFLALHGGQGEDGTVQALLGMVGATYTGSGPLASALAMDKDLSKRLLRAAGVGTPEWLMAPATADEVRSEIGFPVVVKPSKQGSTVGLTVVREAPALDAALAEAWRYDDEVMIERFIPGRELTVGILGGEALPVGEIIPRKEIYDYECKYTAGMAEEIFPAELPRGVAAEAQRQARATFDALKLDGYARVDFRMTDDGALHCLEANTLPGMTELSLIPQGAAAAGITFGELCERIVALALEERRGR